MDFLQLADKYVVVMGVANKKSVAYQVARILIESGARVIVVVRNEGRRVSVQKLFAEVPVWVCDVEYPEEIAGLRDRLAALGAPLHGLLHSIAFADYGDGRPAFHETSKKDFLRAVDVSCYSLIALAGALKSLLDRDASVVTVSISTTRMANQNYGLMAPVKAALDSSLAFLAKSFSEFSRVRFNAVAPGLLKTRASAGIPGYVDAFLYAEQVIPRRAAVTVQEAANVAAFLLSPRSSGINAEKIVVDAGMAINYFDDRIVRGTLDGTM
jgi:enoyl-[acyl-carrier protein] reductase I